MLRNVPLQKSMKICSLGTGSKLWVITKRELFLSYRSTVVSLQWWTVNPEGAGSNRGLPLAAI